VTSQPASQLVTLPPKALFCYELSRSHEYHEFPPFAALKTRPRQGNFLIGTQVRGFSSSSLFSLLGMKEIVIIIMLQGLLSSCCYCYCCLLLLLLLLFS
jgi:hypothetical protein